MASAPVSDAVEPLSALRFAEQFEAMASNIERVIKGKTRAVRLVLTAILANGHVLLEDLPGSGKTVLARAIAQTIDARSSRVQCTPDLLPSDITGSSVVDLTTRQFKFRRGPIFTNILLSDEINRATPKTQSALLEAMQERRVSVDGVTHQLPRPFLLLATQNPIELAGTFPLPEAQLDRFLFKISLGYPGVEAEISVLNANAQGEAIDTLSAVCTVDQVLALQEWTRGVGMTREVKQYVIDLCQATRTDPSLQLPAGPRASLALMHASRVVAASQGREDVLPDDVRTILAPVLAHRLTLTPDAELREETVDMIVGRITEKIRPHMMLGD